MRVRTALRIPREHGAWGMLYIPLVLGAAVAGDGVGRVAWLTLATTFLFIGRDSVLASWRSRSNGRDPGSADRMAVIYLALAAAASVPLLWDGLLGMVPLALTAAVLLIWNGRQAARREERSIFTEVLGISGLTLTAPAAYYVALGHWGVTAWWLWALSAAYFTSSVFYVKLRVATAHPRSPEQLERIRGWCGLYHGGLVLAAGVAVAAQLLHPLILPAYVPVIVRAFWHVVWPAKTLVLRRVGRLEIAYSLVFLVFAVWSFLV